MKKIRRIEFRTSEEFYLKIKYLSERDGETITEFLHKCIYERLLKEGVDIGHTNYKFL